MAKYTVEYADNGTITETLEFNGKKFYNVYTNGKHGIECQNKSFETQVQEESACKFGKISHAIEKIDYAPLDEKVCGAIKFLSKHERRTTT